MTNRQDIPRKVLAEDLAPLLPKTWQIVDTGRSVDLTRKTVVRLKQLRITRLPEAPTAAHAIEFVATIRVPEQSTQAAEDKLDDQVNALLHALDDTETVSWTLAEKVKLDENALGYDITLTLVSEKE